MFDSLISSGATVLVGIGTLMLLGLVAQKNTAISLIGVAGTAGLSFALTLIHPYSAGEFTSLWPVLIGLAFSAVITAVAAADRPELPLSFDTRPDQRVINAETTSPQALAAAGPKHWALG
ncbi:hypothetical protein [Dietzia sp. 179-F 9C3 NHS]|uniref:hypothetical protein n=1 Tax=Dietzia sp. 179-F 9C3 NHS TaxID=3374295 RepID=UPI00387A0777